MQQMLLSLYVFIFIFKKYVFCPYFLVLGWQSGKWSNRSSATTTWSNQPSTTWSNQPSTKWSRYVWKWTSYSTSIEYGHNFTWSKLIKPHLQVKNCQFMYIEIIVMIFLLGVGGLDLVFRTLYFVNCKFIIFGINYSIIVMRWSSHGSFLMELARCTSAKWKGNTFSGKFNDSDVCFSAIFGSIIEESSRQGCDLLFICCY